MVIAAFEAGARTYRTEICAASIQGRFLCNSIDGARDSKAAIRPRNNNISTPIAYWP